MTERGPIELIAIEQPRLTQEFQDFPTAMWAAPARCAGWNNALVVAHLACHADVYCDTIARALHGDSGPPPGPDGQLSPEAFLARAGDAQQALAQRAPADLLHEFGRSGDDLTEVFSRLTPTDLDLPAWHYTGTLTIGILAAYRLYELGFHGWDVRSTVDPTAQIRPELCPMLVGTVRQLLPLLCRPDAGMDTTCRFEVDEQIWTTRAGGGKLEEGSTEAVPDAIIRTDACTFLLLATMRQTLTECVDRVHIEGSRQRAEQLLDVSRFRV